MKDSNSKLNDIITEEVRKILAEVEPGVGGPELRSAEKGFWGLGSLGQQAKEAKLNLTPAEAERYACPIVDNIVKSAEDEGAETDLMTEPSDEGEGYYHYSHERHRGETCLEYLARPSLNKQKPEFAVLQMFKRYFSNQAVRQERKIIEDWISGVDPKIVLGIVEHARDLSRSRDFAKGVSLENRWSVDTYLSPPEKALKEKIYVLKRKSSLQDKELAAVRNALYQGATRKTSIGGRSIRPLSDEEYEQLKKRETQILSKQKRLDDQLYDLETQLKDLHDDLGIYFSRDLMNQDNLIKIIQEPNFKSMFGLKPDEELDLDSVFDNQKIARDFLSLLKGTPTEEIENAVRTFKQSEYEYAAPLNKAEADALVSAYFNKDMALSMPAINSSVIEYLFLHARTKILRKKDKRAKNLVPPEGLLKLRENYSIEELKKLSNFFVFLLGKQGSADMTAEEIMQTWKKHYAQEYIKDISNSIKIRARHINKFGALPREITFRDPEVPRSFTTFNYEFMYQYFGDGRAKAMTRREVLSLPEAAALKNARNAKNEEEFREYMQQADKLHNRFKNRKLGLVRRKNETPKEFEIRKKELEATDLSEGLESIGDSWRDILVNVNTIVDNKKVAAEGIFAPGNSEICDMNVAPPAVKDPDINIYDWEGSIESRIKAWSFVVNSHPSWKDIAQYSANERQVIAYRLRSDVESAYWYSVRQNSKAYEGEVAPHKKTNEPMSDARLNAFRARAGKWSGERYNILHEKFLKAFPDMQTSAGKQELNKLKSLGSRMKDEASFILERKRISVNDWIRNYMTDQDYEALKIKALKIERYDGLQYTDQMKQIQDQIRKIYKSKVEDRALADKYSNNFDLVVDAQDRYEQIIRTAKIEMKNPFEIVEDPETREKYPRYQEAIDDESFNLMAVAMKVEKRVHEIAKKIRFLRCRQISSETPKSIVERRKKTKEYNELISNIVNTSPEMRDRAIREFIHPPSENFWIGLTEADDDDPEFSAVTKLISQGCRFDNEKQKFVCEGPHPLGFLNVPLNFKEFWGATMTEAYEKIIGFSFDYTIGMFIPEEFDLTQKDRAMYRSLLTSHFLVNESMEGRRMAEELRIALDEGMPDVQRGITGRIKKGSGERAMEKIIKENAPGNIKIVSARKVIVEGRASTLVVVQVGSGMRPIAFTNITGVFEPIGGVVYLGHSAQGGKLVVNSRIIGYPGLKDSKHPFGSISKWLSGPGAPVMTAAVENSRVAGVTALNLSSSTGGAALNEYLKKHGALKDRWLDWWDKVLSYLTPYGSESKYKKHIASIMSEFGVFDNPRHVLTQEMPKMTFLDQGQHIEPQVKFVRGAAEEASTELRRVYLRPEGSFRAPDSLLGGTGAHQIELENLANTNPDSYKVYESMDTHTNARLRELEQISGMENPVSRLKKLEELHDKTERKWKKEKSGKRAFRNFFRKEVNQQKIDQLYDELQQLRRLLGKDSPPGTAFDALTGARKWGKNFARYTGITSIGKMTPGLKIAFIGMLGYEWYRDFMALQNTEIDPETGKHYDLPMAFAGATICALTWLDPTVITTTLFIPIRGFWFKEARNPLTITGASFCLQYGDRVKSDGSQYYPECLPGSVGARLSPAEQKVRQTRGTPVAAAIEAEEWVRFPYYVDPRYKTEEGQIKELENLVDSEFFGPEQYNVYESWAKIQELIELYRGLTAAIDAGFETVELSRAWKAKLGSCYGFDSDCAKWRVAIEKCQEESGLPKGKTMDLRWQGDHPSRGSGNQSIWDERNKLCLQWVESEIRKSGFRVGRGANIPTTPEEIASLREKRRKSLFTSYTGDMKDYLDEILSTYYIPAVEDKELSYKEHTELVDSIKDNFFHFQIATDLSLAVEDRRRAKELLYKAAEEGPAFYRVKQRVLKRTKLRNRLLKIEEEKIRFIKAPKAIARLDAEARRIRKLIDRLWMQESWDVALQKSARYFFEILEDYPSFFEKERVKGIPAKGAPEPKPSEDQPKIKSKKRKEPRVRTKAKKAKPKRSKAKFTPDMF